MDGSRTHLVRAVLIAVVAAVGWFIWALVDETSGSCFGAAHYVPSAAVVLAAAVVVQVGFDARRTAGAGDTSAETRPIRLIVTGAAVVGVLAGLGLLAGGAFAAAASCSA